MDTRSHEYLQGGPDAFPFLRKRRSARFARARLFVGADAEYLPGGEAEPADVVPAKVPGDEKRTAAVLWACAGIPIIEVHPLTKQPVNRNWPDTATCDPEEAFRRWSNPDGTPRDYNIGGSAGGFVCIDVDVKDGKSGEASLAKLCADVDATSPPGSRPFRDQLDATLCTLTPSGGRHYWFAAASPVACSTSRLGAGLDVRGRGGQALLPGSTLAGGAYTIGRLAAPLAAPPALVTLCGQRVAREPSAVAEPPGGWDAPADVAWAREYLTQAPIAREGDGGEAETFRVACRVRDHGISEGTAVDLMVQHYADRCAPPWEPGELADKVANAYRYATGTPGRDGVEQLATAYQSVTLPAADDSPFETFTPADLAARPAPPRPWHIEGWMPRRNVSSLYGAGATGKSLLALQLGVATAAGVPWLGLHVVEPGAVVYLSAEDERDECHRRLERMCSRLGVTMGQVTGLHIVDLSSVDATFATFDRSYAMATSAVWKRFVLTCRLIRPRLIVVDNLADVFGGDEISKVQVRRFVGLLRGLSHDTDAAVLVLAHPSQAGANTGEGTAGSVAWSNSVRSRLFLERAKATLGGKADTSGDRTLRVMKANYAPQDVELRLGWGDGCFVAGAQVSAAAGAADQAARADAAFLGALRAFTRQGRNVSAKPSATYAPKMFEETTGLPRKALAAAMERLFAAGRLRTEETGPPSKRREHMIEVRDDGAATPALLFEQPGLSADSLAGTIAKMLARDAISSTSVRDAARSMLDAHPDLAASLADVETAIRRKLAAPGVRVGQGATACTIRYERRKALKGAKPDHVVTLC